MNCLKYKKIKKTPILDALWDYKNKTVFGPIMSKWEWNYICKNWLHEDKI